MDGKRGKSGSNGLDIDIPSRVSWQVLLAAVHVSSIGHSLDAVVAAIPMHPRAVLTRLHNGLLFTVDVLCSELH